MNLRDKIREVSDFPDKGVIFRDITPILQDGTAFAQCIDNILESLNGLDFDLIAAPESRGFLLAAPVAYACGKGLVPIRKKGKLPGPVIQREYTLEYGTATLEIHTDAIVPGQKVILLDDVLATGGTALAMAKLIEDAGGVVSGMRFFIELLALKGKEAIQKSYEIKSLLKF